MAPAAPARRRLRLVGGHVLGARPAAARAQPPPPQQQQLDVRPLGPGAIGAAILGLDAAVPLSPEARAALRGAVDRWGVVCLRDQRRLRHERQAELATEVFGTAVEPHALWGDEEWMRHTGNRHTEGLPP
jgi:alpha-ketoglutarate-dependent taurine dioxygenase